MRFDLTDLNLFTTIVRKFQGDIIFALELAADRHIPDA
jgi:hypothetical protein